MDFKKIGLFTLLCITFFVPNSVIANDYDVNEAYDELQSVELVYYTIIPNASKVEQTLNDFFGQHATNLELLKALKNRLDILVANQEGKSDMYKETLNYIVSYNNLYIALATEPERTEQKIVKELSHGVFVEQDNVDTYVTFKGINIYTYGFNEPLFDIDWTKPWNKNRLELVKDSITILGTYGDYVIITQHQWEWTDVYIFNHATKELVYEEKHFSFYIDIQAGESGLYLLSNRERGDTPALIQINEDGVHELFDKQADIISMELLVGGKVKIFYKEWTGVEKSEIVDVK